MVVEGEGGGGGVDRVGIYKVRLLNIQNYFSSLAKTGIEKLLQSFSIKIGSINKKCYKLLSSLAKTGIEKLLQSFSVKIGSVNKKCYKLGLY